jgi:SAM-dependent methyltransferase
VKPSLLEFLACPACAGDLALSAGRAEGQEVMDGTLDCSGCGGRYPVRGGVPRFAQAGQSEEAERTAAAFGWQWKAFPQIEPHHEQQFLDWIAPADRANFVDRVVIEGGCGKGRHTRLAARYGARAVIGVDLSEAVDVAYANTRGEPNAHIIQADLLHLPLKAGCCDYAFSVGVLHHLTDPSAGFQSLAMTVRPGGVMSVWVYGAEGNAWIARFVSPARVAVTSRLPPRILYGASLALTIPLWIVLAAVYRPARRAGLAWVRRFLFYYPYLGYISGFPFWEVHTIVHDHLAAPVSHYLRREQVEAWYRGIDAREVVIAWHNKNSWRGFGILPGGREATGGAVPGGAHH